MSSICVKLLVAGGTETSGDNNVRSCVSELALFDCTIGCHKTFVGDNYNINCQNTTVTES